jgi:hypothetical protein
MARSGQAHMSTVRRVISHPIRSSRVFYEKSSTNSAKERFGGTGVSPVRQ